MEASGLVGDCLSPESTVTSLLSSSGHLRSSLLAPEHNTTFRYRDQNYYSASAALDAYITDFERSRQDSASLTGRLLLPHSLPSTLSRPRVSALRNKDVLRERLTDRELDFLNLPVSSLHHRGNRDRLSMTTDELLSIPYDGSMPVTHTSAFIQGFLSQSGPSEPPFSSSRPAHRTWDRLSSSHGAPQLNHHHLHPTRMPRSSRYRERPGAAMLNPHVDVSSASCHRSAHRAARSEWASPSLHLPHWFTSNRPDMDCSGITSVPDIKYPAWVQRCDLSETPPPTESELWDDPGVLPPAAPRNKAPSWVAELEVDDPDQTPDQRDQVDQRTLRDLRLQFAEQISVLAAERHSSDVMETLFRDNRMESLIQKADQVLNSLSHSSGEADGPADPVVSPTDCVEEAVSPVNTEELLLCSSHRRPFAWDSEAASGSITEAPPHRGAQALVSGLHGNSIFKQPGPVEALKQMLFRLQAVEAELQRQQHARVAKTEEAPVKQTVSGHMELFVFQRPEGDAELERFPGGPSLQRAMHHLSRLKVLVEEPREKHPEEEGERDEDEGRYSSSSADGLICSQQKPS
ncbi:lung adenoma susceptibility protein 2 isoform X2 [Anarhichas minor]|uniref:lung adenoma susceptibility protein 2 isoform X2 n=1 Tax=Anarhichas minor TaxID=65739 RepID=UPI003F73A737